MLGDSEILTCCKRTHKDTVKQSRRDFVIFCVFSAGHTILQNCSAINVKTKPGKQSFLKRGMALQIKCIDQFV